MSKNPIRLSKVIDPTVIKDGFRLIKMLWMGRDVFRQVIHAKEPGTDTNPQPGTKMLILNTLNPKEDVAVLCVDDRNTRKDLQPGEKAFYSYDKDGVPLFIITIRGGKMEVGTAPNGTPPANFAVRFNEMEVAFNEQKASHNKLVDAFNQHMHATAAPGPPVIPTPIPTVIPASSSTADMSDAKSTELTIN